MRAVLLVDSDSDNRLLVTAGLRAAQFDVVDVCTLATAETISVRMAVDLVVVSSQMPDGSAIAFVERLRVRNRTVPIILTSASNLDGQALDHVTKDLAVGQVIDEPIAVGDLVDRVRLLLDRPEAPAAPDPGSTLVAALEALQAEFTAKLPEKLRELETAVALAQTDPSGIASARGLAHRLRGSSGSYGHAELGEAVGRVEDLLAEAQAAPGSVRPALWPEVDEALRETHRCLEKGPRHDEHGFAAAAPPQKAILVVDDDPDFLQFATTVGKKLLLNVATAESASQAIQQAQSAPLLGVVLDVHLANRTSFSLAREIRDTEANAEVPIAFASVDNCIGTRIAAIEAGGTHFFEKPMSAENFAELAQQFVALSEASKGKVLIVDDDPDILEHYSFQLRSAGVGVETLDSAEGITEKLDQIAPDVLLLDINLPGISGLDVCAALRKSEHFEAIPILIITAQTDDRTRLLAFRAGACDVVTKPVIPEELMARVGVQLERVRFQRDRADLDPLSGLFARRALIAKSQRALAAATRAEKPLSLVLLDIDRFKMVNDTFGHLAGDRVIAGLGDLLRRRFRVDDIRGRWGGEEFLLVFPGQDYTFAERAARTILREFSALCFESEEGTTFSVTFTAGVATCPRDGTSITALIRRADERLYEGKEQGRNQVVGPSDNVSRPSNVKIG